MKANTTSTKESLLKRLREVGFGLDTLSPSDYASVKSKLGWSEGTFKTALSFLKRPTKGLTTNQRDYIPSSREDRVIQTELGNFGIILRYLGCRFNEMWSFRVTEGWGEVLVMTQKGGDAVKISFKDMPPVVQEAVKQWVSTEGRNTSPSQIRRRWKKLQDQGKLTTRCTPHSFRHNLVTQSIDSGASIFQTTRMVGHKPREMNERYYHCSPSKQATLRNLALGYV